MAAFERVREERDNESPEWTMRGTAFLRAYGEQSPVKRAIVRAWLSEAKWRASCPGSIRFGLCVQPADEPNERPRCDQTLQPPFRALNRDPSEALLVFEEVVGSAALDPASEAIPEGLYEEAIAMARIRLLDAEIEQLLVTSSPQQLDFSRSMALSQEAFNSIRGGFSKRAIALSERYANVERRIKAPNWRAVAASRMVLLLEVQHDFLIRIPIEAPVLSSSYRTQAWCSAFHSALEPVRKGLVRAREKCNQVCYDHGQTISSEVCFLCNGRS